MKQRNRKYRVWDNDNKKMLYSGFALIPTSPSFSASRLHGENDSELQNLIQQHFSKKIKEITKDENFPDDWGDYSMVDWTDFTELIVMDCINPKADTKNQYYEGDIIRIYELKNDENPEDNISTDHVVVFSNWDDYPCFMLNPSISDELNDISALYHDDWIEDWEVIGNIYEHPTLIPEKYKKND